MIRGGPRMQQDWMPRRASRATWLMAYLGNGGTPNYLVRRRHRPHCDAPMAGSATPQTYDI